MTSVAIVLLDRERHEAFGDNRKEKLRFQKSTFSMFDGKIETVTMLFRINMLNAVIDKSGRDVFITPVNKDAMPLSRLAIDYSTLSAANAFDAIGTALYALLDHIRKLQAARLSESLRKTEVEL